MDEFFRYLADPHLFDPTIVRIIDYVRYLFLGIGGAMFVAIIYFIIDTSALEEKYFKDVTEFTKTSPYKSVKVPGAWKKAKKQSESEDESERKLAVIEVDDMTTQVLNQMGYEGDSLEEALSGVSGEIIPNKEDLLNAHKKRRDLVYDPNYDLSMDEAKRVMDIYEQTFKDLQIL